MPPGRRVVSIPPAPGQFDLTHISTGLGSSLRCTTAPNTFFELGTATCAAASFTYRIHSSVVASSSTMGEQQQSSSNWNLLLAAGSAGVLGFALGYKLAMRNASGRAGGRRRGPKLVYGARLGPAASGNDSTDSTPAATPRCLSREDSARGSGLRMALLVRTDLALVRGWKLGRGRGG